MRTKKVTRYYCDHCGRGHFFKSKALTHESGCTANQNRVCNVCHETGPAATLAELLAILDRITNENKKEVMKELADASEQCPACQLAALRQHPKTKIKGVLDGDIAKIVFTDFSIKEAWKNWVTVESEERACWRF